MFDMRDIIIEFWRQFNLAKTDNDYFEILQWIEQTFIEFFVDGDIMFHSYYETENNISLISITDYFPMIEMVAQIWRHNPLPVRKMADSNIAIEFVFSELEKVDEAEIEKMKYKISPFSSPFIARTSNLLFNRY